jgi:arylsulfatase
LISRLRTIVALAALVLTASLAFAQAAPGDRRPNVLVILADDMGWSDIGAFGSEISTPNIDTLAAGGVKFTQFYNTARCCPSRASLLTGLYPHQAGVGHMLWPTGYPGYTTRLSRDAVTMAEVLRDAGYGTYMTG